MLVKSRYFNGLRQTSLLLSGLFLLLSAGCGEMAKKSELDENGNYNSILVVYDERESNQDKTTFQTEIRILPHHMLISDNRNKSGYLLVDRDKKIIYNINREDKTIMVIKQQAITTPSPVKIDYEMVSQPSSAIPKIASVSATHYRIDVNGEHCYDVVSAGKEFLPKITQAMVEFRQILASEHAKSVSKIPQEMIDACDLALNVYHSTDHLANGFPFREWDQHGYLRFIRYWMMNQKVKPEQLELPKGYETYSVP